VIHVKSPSLYSIFKIDWVPWPSIGIPIMALLIIDVQNDFVADGALAVPDGLAVVPKINELRGLNIPTFLSQDWHPEDHCSFVTNNPGATVFTELELENGPQMMWPAHCVQGSKGAEFVEGLVCQESDVVIQKGVNSGIDSYSAFGDSTGKREVTPLLSLLCQKGITTVVCCGLALDYCVSYTACDAAKFGFKTYVVLDACRGISEASIAKEIERMNSLGVTVVATMADLPELLN